MIYLFCIAIVCGAAGLGKIFAQKYVLRDLFFADFSNFLIMLKNNLSFKKMKVDEVFDEFINDGTSLKNQFQILKSAPIDIINSSQFWFLKKEEKLAIKRFVTDLGSGNDAAEMQNIENFIGVIKEKGNVTKDLRTKNEGLIFKVSLAIGAVICILIL